MKDYNCTFAQFVYFVKQVEGEETIIDDTFWFHKKRIEVFLRMFKVSEKAPNTLGNKAKILAEVCYLI